ncbi:Rv3654c family TadE-like protein [Streptomyces celluloflavus]|uniref:Rv3654c family TadE-like protein n=1 Tax=Streptomyces celluloflavus TaxID=58344 RepID=A0ABW7RDE5_9ACTN
MRRRPWGDEGSATVWTVFAMAALCAVFVALIGLGQVVTARHRAGGAADLAALAAADHAREGPATACAAARRVAAAQHARLVRCSLSEAVADVSAEAGRHPFTSRVRSRAGPPTAIPGGPSTAEPGEQPGQEEQPDQEERLGQEELLDREKWPDQEARPDRRTQAGPRVPR